MGVMEPQLCLPIGWRTQCRIKLAVTVLLSLLFGVMVPLAFEGQRILPDFSPKWAGETSKLLLPLASLAAVAGSIGLLSFYTSTLTRNSLQALGLSCAAAEPWLPLSCDVYAWASRSSGRASPRCGVPRSTASARRSRKLVGARTLPLPPRVVPGFNACQRGMHPHR